MKILVTGGAGYIGSTLTPMLLAAGHTVRVLDNLMHGGQSLLGVWSNPAFEFMAGDIRDPERVRQAVLGVEAVVHLAAIVGDPACARDPDLAKEVNLNASLRLLRECDQAGVSRFLFASTCSNYGKMRDPSSYVDETSELLPVSLYAETKVAMEEAIRGFNATGTTDGMCTTCLRLATVFGVSPRMRFDLTVNEFTLEMITKKHLVVFGEQFWRPYIHVRDAARAMALVVESRADRVRGETFNVGSTDQNYQKQQLVELIRPHAPDAIVQYVRKDEDPRDYRVGFQRIQTRLGFQISRAVPDGIREVAELIRYGLLQDFSDSRYRN